jgi:hypothetical protein
VRPDKLSNQLIAEITGRLGIIAEGHTLALRSVLPHLADQLRHSIPVLFASRIVELLDVMRSLYCVGLAYRSQRPKVAA